MRSRLLVLTWYLQDKSEKFLLTLIYLLPRRFVYWCALRVISAATVGKYSGQVVPDLTAMDALQRWDMR